MKFAGVALMGLVAPPRIACPAEPLRMGFPLSLDAFPLKFAIKEGVFSDHGLEVEIVSIVDDLARRDAFISGRLDGLICDVATVVFGLANAGAGIAVTSTAFESVKGSPVLALMGSGPFGIHSLEELFARVTDKPAYSVMLLEGSDMHFATDQLLASLGGELNSPAIYISGRDLPNIYRLLIGGGVPAAVLPEPLAALAGSKNTLLQEEDRAVYLCTYEEVELLPSVIAFQKRVLRDRRRQIGLFYRAYGAAVDGLNRASQKQMLRLASDFLISPFGQVSPVSLHKADILAEGVTGVLKRTRFPQPRPLLDEELQTAAGAFDSQDLAKISLSPFGQILHS